MGPNDNRRAEACNREVDALTIADRLHSQKLRLRHVPNARYYRQR